MNHLQSDSSNLLQGVVWKKWEIICESPVDTVSKVYGKAIVANSAVSVWDKYNLFIRWT